MHDHNSALEPLAQVHLKPYNTKSRYHASLQIIYFSLWLYVKTVYYMYMKWTRYTGQKF